MFETKAVDLGTFFFNFMLICVASRLLDLIYDIFNKVEIEHISIGDVALDENSNSPFFIDRNLN
ncbi:uncharacterized protein CELE_T24D8.6 [Caenorhabditis elegans]|uniref:Uncharacterized protein n=1 Tax=Caenorhabditis elegans TaxID=6239 RepID=Q22742_CAEEL|nr:Uncharacterized protein CELE_T24D8.6 [Caenorhabditis elegans]CCD71463.1 Uncharacterized protein CELE_T24D8.6 [Caenorhabditis elegans]|eukprot:NP_508429.1 Uncharacterized protein CELE_T24D8.6 [Caenorhabditis elegans]